MTNDHRNTEEVKLSCSLPRLRIEETSIVNNERNRKTFSDHYFNGGPYPVLKK